MQEDINTPDVPDNPDDDQGKQKQKAVSINRLKKSKTDKLLFGVCGGIGEFFKVDSVFVRLIFVLSLLMGGWGIIIYLVLIIAIPKAEDKFFMGEPKEISLKYLFGTFFIFLGIYLFLRKSEAFLFFNFFGLNKEIFIPFILAVFGFALIKRKGSSYRPGFNKKIYWRSVYDRKIFGVCGGLSSYFSIDSTTVRLLWIFFSVVTLGIGIFAYLLFTFLVPSEKDYSFAEHI